MSVSLKEYSVFDEAYEFLNEKLFGNNLPDVLITLNRKKNARGYFSFERIVSRDNPKLLISEIGMNPDYFQERSDLDILSTLCHEACHVFQFYLGNRPEKPKYHDREFSEIMEKIGLFTSSTGEEGGRRQGVKISHYIIPDGKFEKCCIEFLKNHKLNWQNLSVLEKEKKTRERKSKLKYVCPDCERSVSSKDEIKVMCMSCNQEMEEQIL